MTIEYRFYGPDGSRRQIYATAFGTARWKTTRYGGYVESTFTLSGTAAQLSGSGGIQPPQEGDRVRVFVNGQLRYSGMVATPNFSVSDPLQTTINAYGKYKQIAGIPVDGRFISTVPVDVSVAIASFVNSEVRAAFPLLYTDFGPTDYGLDTQLEDAFNKTFGDLMSTFSDRLEGLAVFGVDEFPTELGDTPVDRFYLRGVGSLEIPDYTIPIPGPFLGSPVRVQQGGLDNTKLVNILTVGGSDALYPNYLGGGCNGNVSFERPVFTTSSTGKIFGPFYMPKSTSAGGIIFISGASPKSGGLQEGPVYLGDRMALLDNIGEGVQFTETQSKRLINSGLFTIEVGTPYVGGDTVVAVVVARRTQSQYDAAIEITIQWRNSGTPVGSPITFDYDLQDAVWREYSSQFFVPSSPVTDFDFIVTLISKAPGVGALGAVIGTAYAYVSALKQDGWAVLDEDGTGRIPSIDYINTSNVKEGRYSISIDANGTDSDGHAVLIRPVAVCKLPGGMPLLFSWWVKMWPGTSNGKIFLSTYFFNASGAQIGGVSRTTINAGTYADTDGWVQLHSFVNAPSDAASCTPILAFRGHTQCYVDAGMLRSQSIPLLATVPRNVYEWIDAGAYRTLFRADDPLFAGMPFDNSIADKGPFYGTIQNDSVYDYYTGLYLAQQYLGAFGLPYAHPIIEIDNCPLTFLPGQSVKLAGVLGPWISGGDTSKVFVIAEVEEIVQASGLLTTTLYLDKENPSTERIVREMIRKFNLTLTGAGANTGLSSRGSSVGGGAVGGQAGYTSVQQAAVAAPTRNVINFTGSGVVVTDNDPNGSTDVTVAGGLPVWTISAQSTNYVITNNAFSTRVQMDATLGARTVTLPAVSGFIGELVSVSKVDVSINTVTILAGGTDTLNIVAGINILNAQWQSITLIGTAGGWETV